MAYSPFASSRWGRRAHAEVHPRPATCSPGPVVLALPYSLARPGHPGTLSDFDPASKPRSPLFATAHYALTLAFAPHTRLRHTRCFALPLHPTCTVHPDSLFFPISHPTNRDATLFILALSLSSLCCRSSFCLDCCVFLTSTNLGIWLASSRNGVVESAISVRLLAHPPKPVSLWVYSLPNTIAAAASTTRGL